MTYLWRRRRKFDLFVVFLGSLFVLTGELVNLFVSGMAVYSECDGIPVYIVLAGALLVWGMSTVAWSAGRKAGDKRRLAAFSLLLAFSFFLPLVELFGLKTGLWSWRRSYPLFSFVWYSGVWRYYFIFLVVPAILAEFFRPRLSLTGMRDPRQNSTPPGDGE
jgi:hypothetical protein